jgi:anti-sigma factor RsiW
MNQSEFDNLLQTAPERDLTDGELARLESWLAANPADQAKWEVLDHLLAALPDTPVATNFTARVLDEVRSAEASRPALGQAWWLRLLAPQFRPIQIAAAAMLAMVIGGVGYQSHLNQSRAEMAAAVVSIAEFTPVFLADIEAIEAVAQAAAIDEELWAALK